MISEREDSQSFRYTTVLPKKHTIVTRSLAIDNRLLHAIVQTVILSLREEYWNLEGKKTVRSVLSKCIISKKTTGKKLSSISNTTT